MIVAVAFLLGACQSSGSGTEDQQAAEQPVYTAEEGLSAGERMRKALRLLEVGEAEQARPELVAYLAEKPDSKMAKRLLEQIDADPVEMLGEQNFLYTMQSGDSISTVAMQFLGDPLKFHILAKYNGIDNPSRIKIGQTIKVPGEAPAAAAQVAAPAAPAEEAATTVEEPAAEVVTEQPAAEPEPDKAAAIYEEASALTGDGNYGEAIVRLEEGTRRYPTDEKLRGLLIAVYSDHARTLSEQEDNLEARAVLRKAEALQPANDEISQLLAGVERKLAAERYYRAGMEYLEADVSDHAFDAFSEAVKLWPGYKPAEEELAKVRPVVADQYHRRALLAFKRQELDEALRLWDEVLRIDPNHANAKIYRAQALELKEQLKSLE